MFCKLFSQGALNSVAEAHVDTIRGLFGIDSDEMTRVFGFGGLEEFAELQDLIADTSHASWHQLASNALVGGLSLSWREELS